MKLPGIAIIDLVARMSDCDLELVAGHSGAEQRITNLDINRPGLALAGHYADFASDRIQIVGKGEYSFLQNCGTEIRSCISEDFFGHQMPGIVFTHGNHPQDLFLSRADEKGIALLKTASSTHDFVVSFTNIMSDVLAERDTIHGVLIDVFGVGILLKGQSGIGKSETALELIERGHRLISDDRVNVKKTTEGTLIGEADPMLGHHMELRGIGIINIKDLFGIGAIRHSVTIDLVIHLEDWNEKTVYDRLGLDEKYTTINEVSIPEILLPVRPGRNLPILIETAAINHRSRRMGNNAAENLSNQLNERIRMRQTEAEKSSRKENDTGEAGIKKPRTGFKPRPLMSPM